MNSEKGGKRIWGHRERGTEGQGKKRSKRNGYKGSEGKREQKNKKNQGIED